MNHVFRLMHRYREVVTDPAWQCEQERKENEKLDRYIRRLMEWDGVSEELPQSPRKH